MNIAIINTNDLNYSELDKTHSRLKKDYLEDDIEEYIQFVNVENPHDAMENIIKLCNFDHEELIHTTIISESSKYIYYMIHTIDDKGDKQYLNKIAMYLTNNVYRITGNIGIIKEEIHINGFTELSKISFNNILDIFSDRFVHKCIIINNNQVDEIKYIFNPIDWINANEASNYKFIEYELFDKIMMMFIELNPINDVINEKASILYGKKVNGKAIFALRSKPNDIKHTEFAYENLSVDMIEKLLSILSVDHGEFKESDEEKNIMKVYNFHTVLEKRYSKYINKYGKGYSTKLLLNIKNDISTNNIAQNHILSQNL